MANRLVALGVAVATAVWLGWLWMGLPEVTWAVAVASGTVMAGALCGVALDPRRHATAHMTVAAALLLVLGGFAFLSVVDKWPFAWNALPDRRYAALITVLSVASSVGLVRGTVWGRWMALAFCSAVALGGALNSVGMEYYGNACSEMGFEAAIGVLGGLVVLTRLAAPSVRERVSKRAPVWTTRDRLVWSARWAAIAAFAAAPMLVLYALCQPVAAETVTPALVLAPVLALGGGLVVARRTIGLLVLLVTGGALMALTIATLELAPHEWMGVASYYSAFWTPAAVLGIVAGAMAVFRARS